MSIKIGLLGFGTVASGIPFLLKEPQYRLRLSDFPPDPYR